MNIVSAEFVKGLVAESSVLENKDTMPQVAIIGRSNVGKSSMINALTHQRGLAHTSSFPGHTQEINIFLINKKVYLMDLPGYGFAKTSKATQDKLTALINWYLFNSPYTQKKVLLLIDAVVGVTDHDEDMLDALRKHQKNIVVVATKVDKLGASERAVQLKKIATAIGDDAITIIPYSSKKNTGIKELTNTILE
jgi:GTP-binding protein